MDRCYIKRAWLVLALLRANFCIFYTREKKFRWRLICIAKEIKFSHKKLRYKIIKEEKEKKRIMRNNLFVLVF